MQELMALARRLVAPGKGLLAADESLPTIEKRFTGVGVTSTDETRRAWRDLLFTSPRLEEWLSGVIMFDETLRQRARDGRSFVELLEARGIIPGVKVDAGAKALAASPGEKVTEGLDGLRERLREYRELGARFTKWRAVIAIGDGAPSSYCIRVNAHALARFAALSQEAGLVPIVEPEVLMDGAHDIERCYAASAATLHRLFVELHEQRVVLEGLLLKTNMVLSGKAAEQRAPAHEVAEWTLRCLRRCVPVAVPGVLFLSGGQSGREATINLDAVNKVADDAPWELSFSFARALQDEPMHVWAGSPDNVAGAQEVFQRRCQETSAARRGRYRRRNRVEASASSPPAAS